MWNMSIVKAAALVAAVLFPFQAYAPMGPPRFDPSSVSPAGLFEGPDADLSAEHLDWRRALCAHETRNLDEWGRDDALSRKNAVGRCQVLLPTARLNGFVGPTYALFFERVNEEAADRTIAACFDRRGWKNTLRAVAYCYAGGPRRRFRVGSEWYHYALNVEERYRKVESE